jgi:protein O-GlcNAc transferase
VRLAGLLAVVASLGADEAVRLLAEANAHYQARRPAEAVRLYREYLGRYPGRADVRVFLGAALLNLDRPEEALAEVARAVALDRRYAKAHVLAGRIHAGRLAWGPAQQAYQAALELDPSDRETWYFSGRAWYEENRFEKAVEAFRKALELGAGQSRVHENLGLALEALGRPEEAEKTYRRAVELSTTEYRPALAYGTFLQKQDRLEGSVEMLTRALRLEPGAVEVHFELGKVLSRLGRLEEAARTLEAGLVISDQCRLRYLLAGVYSRQDKSAEAGRQLKALEGCRQAP